MVPEGAVLIIVAGGMSTRMGNGIKKELADLNGEPVLCRTLRPFFETELFSMTVIVLPPPRIDQTKTLIASCLPSVMEDTVIYAPGGKTRQESVYNGLRELPSSSRTVLIHDGARPWITKDVILRVYEKTVQTGAAVPVVPSVNALKEIDSDGRVIRNLDRSIVVGAQTPQGFAFKDILSAHRKAAGDGRVYRDDAEVFSAYAGEVFTVPGDIRNKKITYREDLQQRQGGKI